jgi:hypothetical protein
MAVLSKFPSPQEVILRYGFSEFFAFSVRKALRR